jgi:uncharacterized protein YutE (UPF0331/DUF86 family)
MSTLETIENKISHILKHLAQTKKYQDKSLEEVTSDRMLQSAVERELYLTVQASIDLAEAVVTFRKLRKPTTMREAFEVLAENRILPEDFTERLIGIVGFRNALAHDYEDLKVEIVYDVLQNKLSQIEDFIGHVKKALDL